MNLSPKEGAVASALRTLSKERDGLNHIMDALAGKPLGSLFQSAVTLLSKTTGRVILTGMGKSGHVARKIAATFASTGTPAYYVHPGEASHGDLGMIQAEDVIIALSWSGETSELSDLISYAKRFRVGLVAITSNHDSALGREADICLALPKAPEACPNGLAPTTSTTMQLAFGDALAVALLEHRGFSANDFGKLHPGGKLGALLKQVNAIMHRDEALPIVRAGTLMSDALVVQSEKGFGCALVVAENGQLLGIITDGDLRRHMGADLLTLTVEAVMTASPLTIAPSTLVSEALEIVESTKRSALVVVEEGRVVGLLHVLDLLRAGAV